MKLIEFVLPFQTLLIEFQTSLLVFEIQVCKIQRLLLDLHKNNFNDFSSNVRTQFLIFKYTIYEI